MPRIVLLFIVQIVTLTLLQAQPFYGHYKAGYAHHVAVTSFANKEKDTLTVLSLLEKSKEEARKSSQIKDLIKAYTQLAYWFPKQEDRLLYIDSALVIAQKSTKKELIGSVFFDKGEVYLLDNNWNKTLEYYLQAADYSSKTTDEYLKHKVKYGIASVKLLLGDYEESLEMATSCADFFKAHPKENSHRYYLKSLHLAGLCHNQLGNFDKCSAINTKGRQASQALLFNKLEVLFVYSEAVNLYDQQHYTESIAYLQQALAFAKAYKNNNLLLSAYAMLGKNYLQLAEYEQATSYFVKADSLSTTTTTLISEMKEGYIFLANKAEKEGDLEQKLGYLNKLIAVESVFHNQYKQLSSMIYKEYDNKKLLLSIQETEETLAKTGRKHQILQLIGIITIVISIIIIGFSLYKKQQYQRKTKASAPLLNGFSVSFVAETPQKNTAITNKNPINERVTHHILQRLERFESNRDYLKQNITLTYLATKFKTNPKYISSVIKSHKHKEFIQYINELRFEYLTTMLAINKYRHYTIEALAGELGFSSAKGFNQAFYKSKGIKVADFIKEFRNNPTS